jgi:hypothetical protein
MKVFMENQPQTAKKHQQIHVVTNLQPVAKGVLSSKNLPWLYTSRYFHIYFILTKNKRL